MDRGKLISVAVVSLAAVCYHAVQRYPYEYFAPIVKRNIETEYDYIIVGGGTAGPVVASRLAEDPDVRVLLLEAGGDYTENRLFHVPLYYTDYQKTYADWQYYTVPQTHSSLGLKDHISFWPKGRVLGGSNIFNALQYSRGSRHDYDEWEIMGCKGWGYKDVLPYFLKSEDMKIEKLKSSIYHNTGGPIAVSSAAVTEMADVFMQAGREMGYRDEDTNGENQEGFSETPITVRDGTRSSSALEFLGGTKVRRNLHIGINSFVTRVAIERNIAKGVFFIRNNKKHFIKAHKEVILSAGAINSPQILMLSGIGPKEHLTDIGIQVHADLPVGKNLQDHMILVAHSGLNRYLGITNAKRDSLITKLRYSIFGTGVLSSSTNEVTSFMCSVPGATRGCAADVQFMISSKYFKKHKNLFGFENDMFEEVRSQYVPPGFTVAISYLNPKSVGTIKLQSNDPFVHPLIDPAYLTDKRDVDGYIRAMRLWEKFIMTPTMQRLGANFDRVNISVCSEHDFRSDEYWECYIRHFAVTCYHPVGTCKMGKVGDKTAVVDPELRVHGVSGLRVVDASIMPNVISGNTNAAVTMIAEKAADLIRGKDTVKYFRIQTQTIS